MLQLSFIWQAKENSSLRHEGGPTQKTLGGEKNPLHPCLILTPFYVFGVFFSSPLAFPMQTGLARRAVCFTRRFSLWSSDLPLLYFPGLFPSLSFSHQPPPFQAHFSYFNYLTKQLTHAHTTEILYIYMC